MTHAFVRPTRAARAGLFAIASFVIITGTASAQERYKTPPQVVTDMLDAPLLPAASVSPDRAWLVLANRASMPSIAELAEPMLRLAGARVNPRTNGPHRAARFTGLAFKRIADGTERRVSAPSGVALGMPFWSPDSRYVAFTATGERGVALWVAAVETGQAMQVTQASLNAVGGNPCSWLPDSAELLCEFVPANRGAEPPAAAVPAGPNRQVADGRAAPVRTYQDLLENTHDEALFDYYFTARLGRVNARTRTVQWLGDPAVYLSADASPDGRYVLTTTVVRPYSFLVPASLFPSRIEVRDRDGAVVRQIAELPLGERIPIRGTRAGPRGVRWQPGQPATLVWTEALDGGDPRQQVPQRDRIMTLALPAAEPVELARTEWRAGGLQFAERGGLALLLESDRATRRVRTWVINTERRGEAPRVLWDRNAEDRYGDPGSPVMRRTAAGDNVLLTSRDGASLYLLGAGASREGDRPFVDRLEIATGRTTRLFQSADPYYEPVIEILDADRGLILTSRESPSEPPNYWVRDVVRRGAPRQLTTFVDPAVQLAAAHKELVTYRRNDGVQLSGTLYTPPGWQSGQRLPTVLWVYPSEFASADAASQVRGSPNRYTRVAGASHLFLLTQGYAVFDNPSLPVIGGDTANNGYVTQVVAGAQAAIDKLVDMGVTDRQRVGVGGHSYGAFTTANLLAHSDLFRTGIARSGAYNRTLTPFGFQNEGRTYWQAQDVYNAMSPFGVADRINEPILLIHGEADDNSGTFPIQSDRMFMALKGLGATAELVTYPFEAHGYASRETILDCIARMIEWYDRYLKGETANRAASAIP